MILLNPDIRREIRIRVNLGNSLKLNNRNIVKRLSRRILLKFLELREFIKILPNWTNL